LYVAVAVLCVDPFFQVGVRADAVARPRGRVAEQGDGVGSVNVLFRILLVTASTPAASYVSAADAAAGEAEITR